MLTIVLARTLQPWFLLNWPFPQRARTRQHVLIPNQDLVIADI